MQFMHLKVLNQKNKYNNVIKKEDLVLSPLFYASNCLLISFMIL